DGGSGERDRRTARPDRVPSVLHRVCPYAGVRKNQRRAIRCGAQGTRGLESADEIRRAQQSGLSAGRASEWHPRRVFAARRDVSRGSLEMMMRRVLLALCLGCSGAILLAQGGVNNIMNLRDK